MDIIGKIIRIVDNSCACIYSFSEFIRRIIIQGKRDEKVITAAHEAGHAFVALWNGFRVQEVNVFGRTTILLEEPVQKHSKVISNKLVMAMLEWFEELQSNKEKYERSRFRYLEQKYFKSLELFPKILTFIRHLIEEQNLTTDYQFWDRHNKHIIVRKLENKEIEVDSTRDIGLFGLSRDDINFLVNTYYKDLPAGRWFILDLGNYMDQDDIAILLDWTRNKQKTFPDAIFLENTLMEAIDKKQNVKKREILSNLNSPAYLLKESSVPFGPLEKEQKLIDFYLAGWAAVEVLLYKFNPNGIDMDIQDISKLVNHSLSKDVLWERKEIVKQRYFGKWYLRRMLRKLFKNLIIKERLSLEDVTQLMSG